jgi:hypothetical protein
MHRPVGAHGHAPWKNSLFSLPVTSWGIDHESLSGTWHLWPIRRTALSWPGNRLHAGARPQLAALPQGAQAQPATSGRPNPPLPTAPHPTRPFHARDSGGNSLPGCGTAWHTGGHKDHSALSIPRVFPVQQSVRHPVPRYGAPP